MPRKIKLNHRQFVNICETIGYHGTGADFDKFNHKKYLNTGAKSQVFGWGTYITDDRIIALGYSNIVKDDLMEIDKIDEDTIRKLTILISNKYNISEQYAYAHIKDNFKNYERRFNQLTIDIKRIEDFLKSEEKITETDRFNLEIRYDILRFIEKKFKNLSFLYQVEIPDNDGTNYIEWVEAFPKESMRKILEGLLNFKDSQLEAIAKRCYSFKNWLYNNLKWMKENPNEKEKMMEALVNEKNYETFMGVKGRMVLFYNNGVLCGNSIYKRLTELFFNRQKATSLFLMQCGFDGIKYPAGMIWGKAPGVRDDACNYVIFDSNKVKIIKKEKV